MKTAFLSWSARKGRPYETCHTLRHEIILGKRTALAGAVHLRYHALWRFIGTPVDCSRQSGAVLYASPHTQANDP
jgi:hypothetical protein